MESSDDPEQLPDFAPRWMAQRRLAASRLEQLRQQELREMTQSDAARMFAQLDPPRPYPLRPSSGLVEQQRWFQLLRERTGDRASRKDAHHDTR